MLLVSREEIGWGAHRTASDGVHILDWCGHIVDVSESFCKMLGYERDEVIGMYPTQWDAQLAGDEIPATFSALKSGELKRFNTLHRRKDGAVFPVEIHTERFDVEGERYVYCSSRDMTDQRRLERALLEATGNEQHKLGRDVHDGLASSPATSTGMGLKIMQVRAAIIGGRLSIGPGEHGGTLMSCECPQPAGSE